MRLTALIIFCLAFSVATEAQLHKASVNLFKQQTKAIQNALPVECPQLTSTDSTNAFSHNSNHPCLQPAPNKASP